MEASWYIDQIKFEITGGVLESELDDEGYKKIIDMTLQEINRYYDETRFITIPASSCIDLEKYKDINTVSRVYRKDGFGNSSEEVTSFTDPTQVQLFSLGSSYYSNRYASNLIAYSTMQSVLSTTSTDLNFFQDKTANKLYINFTGGAPEQITLEYVPELRDVNQISSDYWINIFTRLATAHAKVITGRIRKKFTQSNALWSLDTDILTEGQEELNTLRETLRVNANLLYPLD